MRVYLVACCVNRPSDDQRQDKIRQETQAILTVLGHISSGEWTMIASNVLQYELGATPDPQRRTRALEIIKLAKIFFRATKTQLDRAEQIEKLGVRGIDALHLACAEAAETEMFLSVDRGLVNAASRNRGQLKVSVMNPVDFVLKVSER